MISTWTIGNDRPLKELVTLACSCFYNHKLPIRVTGLHKKGGLHNKKAGSAADGRLICNCLSFRVTCQDNRMMGVSI